MNAKLEEQPLDALRRFGVFIDHAASPNATAMQEDKDRLEEATFILMYGSKMREQVGIGNILEEFLPELFEFAVEKIGISRFTESFKAIQAVTDISPEMRAAYLTFIRFVFELGLGFGMWEYREKK